MQHVQPQTAVAAATDLTDLPPQSALCPDSRPKKIDVLAALVAAGMSYGVAADALGISRNSTRGLAHRRREAGDVRFAAHHAPAKTKPTNPDHAVRARKARSLPPVPRPAPDAVRLRGLPLFCASSRWQISLPAAPLNLTITEVRDRQCRSMGGSFEEFRCCGAPTDGGPWCPAHRRMLYAGTKRERGR